jgi:hypothetical protein
MPLQAVLCYGQWRTEGGGVGGSNPPRNSEVLTKLSRIPSSVENTSVTTLDIPKVWQSRTGLQIEQNPWLEGYRYQIPVHSALCPQLNLLNPPSPRKKFLGTPLVMVTPLGHDCYNIMFQINLKYIQFQGQPSYPSQENFWVRPCIQSVLLFNPMENSRYRWSFGV